MLYKYSTNKIPVTKRVFDLNPISSPTTTTKHGIVLGGLTETQTRHCKIYLLIVLCIFNPLLHKIEKQNPPKYKNRHSTLLVNKIPTLRNLSSLIFCVSRSFSIHKTMDKIKINLCFICSLLTYYIYQNKKSNNKKSLKQYK